MTRPATRIRMCGVLPAVCAAALAACTTDQPVERQFTEDIGRMALDAQERAAQRDWDAATAILNEALASDTSRYERFVLLRMRGQAYYGLDDLDAAIADWQAALRTGVPSEEEASSLRVNIGQLMIVNGDVEEGASLLERWVRDADAPTESVLITLAQALAGDGQYARALPYAERAREAARQVEPKHLGLLAYLYDQLGRTEDFEAIRRQAEAL